MSYAGMEKKRVMELARTRQRETCREVAFVLALEDGKG